MICFNSIELYIKEYVIIECGLTNDSFDKIYVSIYNLGKTYYYNIKYKFTSGNQIEMCY